MLTTVYNPRLVALHARTPFDRAYMRHRMDLATHARTVRRKHAARLRGVSELKLRADRLEWRTVGDEIVALDVSDATYFAVGAVGARVWPSLAEGTTLDQIVGIVVAEFDVDEPTARRDLEAFLDELATRDLIER